MECCLAVRRRKEGRKEGRKKQIKKADNINQPIETKKK
jgi:hypothetical protein